MKIRLLGSFVLLLVLALPSTSQALITNFKISPKLPYVDETEVTVSWRATSTLKPGYHYEGLLVDPAGERGCASLVTAKSSAHVKKGRVASLVFISSSDREENFEWCDGKASVSISIAKNGSSEGSGTIIGIADFRFYKKP
ncbi:MAG TPA: hypothetical protein VGP18_01640 [Solirubrobacteraceae bacterium]|jgi:hypothetical protein|nr:hypothetical protein [Solirubrobacteraceae bacterium]